jgi:acylphosphatase
MDKVRVRLFISGSVQGVFFRANAMYQAQGLGITGWVRNCRDGRVEVVLEGEKLAVDEMISWCRKGPPGAAVDNLEINREDYQGEFSSFSIRY